MFNYESNEQLLSFPPPSLPILFPSAGSPEVDLFTGSGPGHARSASFLLINKYDQRIHAHLKLYSAKESKVQVKTILVFL